MDDILQGTVALIPPAWQYPEITCARITYEDRSYTTEDFRETPWRQASEIAAYGKRCGLLEVFYTEETSESDEGPFLKEERALVDTITERLGRIAERMQVQSELSEREKTFRDLVENSLVGIVIIQDGKIVYLNPEQKRITGSLFQLYAPLLLDAIHPEDAGRVRANLERIATGEHQRVEMDFRFLREDGGSVEDATWVSCRASRITYHGQEAVLITMMDVTKAKRIELLLRIQDKMASLGHVAAGIAHEIRNPLSGINIYLNALENLTDDHGDPVKVREILGQMKSASEKIESVIRRVMDFSRPSEPRLMLTRINDPVDEAVKLSSVTLRKVGIKMQKHLAEDLPACHADPQMIEQVVLNMITNATEAMKTAEGEQNLRLSTRREGSALVIEVADSGPGVPPHLKDKIFDPFYTTKSGSTGIGLSLSHRMIADHGGTLELATSEWGGALFIIRLPISRKGH